MSDRVERLREAARARHETTLHRAENALHRLAKRGDAVTSAASPRPPGCPGPGSTANPRSAGRSTDSRDSTANRPGRLPSAERTSTDSLRQQLHTYREEITAYATNQELRDQLARRLGAARATAVTRSSRPPQ